MGLEDPKRGSWRKAKLVERPEVLRLVSIARDRTEVRVLHGWVEL